ncbi:MAG TPA: hypothetical protein PLP07_09610 [Pyrinomonadaceae bacterium]|nr:hypothetical protein [Chloracidobacterium sp.]MBP9107931.1 hypothetical protein [Pyrinomonadaceae bacterium]MBK9439136.1 hypothetical protein [Chloracidobacterium sp.]MBK9768563.1 hypothetical protein [Chloracidobacterium sp.]MBL0242064.1 hypothetical protein [Chloracidobacterium sp.]
MKKFTALLLVFILGISIFAQSGYFTVRTVRKGKDFSFPILNFRRNERVETKINQFLQLSELLGLADKKPKNIFEQVMINDGSIYGRKVSLSYDVFANSPRILSVGFYNSMDGATTHWWNRYYNFNAQNGDRISLRDLFSDIGYEKFVELVVKRRSRSYRSEVARKVEPGDREAFLGLLEIIAHDDLSDFSIKAGSITIDGDNLLGKSLCCEGLNMEVVFNLRDFRQYLNEYGRIVFNLQSGNLAKFRSNTLPQLFKGTVDGKSPFVAILEIDGSDGVHGIYAYLKYRKGIYLTGDIEGAKLQLTEHVLRKTKMNVNTDSDHRWVDGGSISGTFDSSVLNGMWLDSTKSVSLPLLASRY